MAAEGVRLPADLEHVLHRWGQMMDMLDDEEAIEEVVGANNAQAIVAAILVLAAEAIE